MIEYWDWLTKYILLNYWTLKKRFLYLFIFYSFERTALLTRGSALIATSMVLWYYVSPINAQITVGGLSISKGNIILMRSERFQNQSCVFLANLINPVSYWCRKSTEQTSLFFCVRGHRCLYGGRKLTGKAKCTNLSSLWVNIKFKWRHESKMLNVEIRLHHSCTLQDTGKVSQFYFKLVKLPPSLTWPWLTLIGHSWHTWVEPLCCSAGETCSHRSDIENPGTAAFCRSHRRPVWRRSSSPVSRTQT